MYYPRICACVRVCFAKKRYDPLQHSTFRYGDMNLINLLIKLNVEEI